MPFSSENGKRYIKDIVSRVPHGKILDIGCGCGTYAKMFPHADLTGVEIWQPYVEKYGLENLYGKLIIADATTWTSDDHYDVAFAGDVLEHMSVDDAQKLMGHLKGCADTVVVSIPIGYYPQGEFDENPHEAHVTDNWTDEEVRRVFGEPTLSHIDGEIGVYIWSKHSIKLKIAVYAISKNEAHFVQRFCESAADADIIMIADTGSDDGLPEQAEACGATVHHIAITPWRFDLARNAALALVPRDMDVCISLDIDEVLQPGWREEIERVWIKGETTRLRYMFDWGCGISFYYEKIHARHGYHWHHPCHEYPVPDGRIEEKWAQTDFLIAVHKPDPTKSRGQYMDLLELSVKEDPDCPRNAFYYARELSFHSRWLEAIEACKNYLKLPRATWQNERCYAYRVMGRCYNEVGQPFEAEKAFQMAASEAPNTREPWCELAMLMYRQSRWEECFAYAMRTLRITDREKVYTCDPEVWGHKAHDLAAISAWNLGLKDIAAQQGKIAAELAPFDDRLQSNLAYYLNKPIVASKPDDGIPNIVHMMYFTGANSREFSLINYLAVRAAHEIQKPDAINFYYNAEPIDNPHWEAIKSYVTLKQMNAPTEFEGVSLNDVPQYQADVVRLRVLLEFGGIYLDTDAILTKPLTEFLNNDCVMAGFVGDISTQSRYPDHSFSAATILAKPKSEFIKMWLNKLADGLQKNVWGWHVVCLPVEIYKENPELITLIDMKKFLPFDWFDTRVLEEGGESILSEIADSSIIHMWDSMWLERLRVIDEAYMLAEKTPFAKYIMQPVIVTE